MNKICLLAMITIFSFNLACWKSEEEEPRSRNINRNSSSPKPSASSTASGTASPTPANSNNTMTSNSTTSEVKSGGYMANLPSGFAQPTDEVLNKIFKAYGAVYVARGGVTPPKTVVFKDEAEVSAYQNTLQVSKENIGGVSVELQSPAMQNLKEAISDAKQNGLTITPRNADSSRRNYNATVENWASRVKPGLDHWVKSGKLSQADANRIKGLSPFGQVPEILKLEEQGMFFAPDFKRSIIYSVAPPGTSQHHTMLALDVSEHENSRVRDILAKHGWFQTVVSDLPHFTFLGVSEAELTNLGLKKVSDGGREFWLPNV